MFKINKLERKKRKIAKKIILFIILLIFLFSLFFLLLRFNKASFVSPIPRGIFTFNKDTNPKLKTVKDLLKKTNIEYLSLISLDSSSFLLILKNNEEVILSSKKELSQQISSLQLIITRSTIEDKHIRRLDFRFDRPVIKYK